MTGGSAQIGWRAEQSSITDEGVGIAPLDQQEAFEPSDGIEPRSIWPAVIAVALVVLSIAWVGTMLFLARGALGAMAPVATAQFVAGLLAVPVAAGVVWLLALRTSSAEAQRFGATSRAMRAEATSLEQRIAALAYVIEDNRLQLAEQIQTFASLGDGATARLSAIGRELADGIGQADNNARALSNTADTAQANLSVLLSTMPRAKTETEALGEAIERVGLTASERAAALDAQIVALGERGREAETVAGGAAQKLAAHIARMEATSETAGARLERVTGEMSGAVDALLDRTAQAVDQSRQGLAAQGDAMLAMVGANQAALDSAARESAEALAERVAIVDHVIDRIAARLETQRVAGDGLVTDLEGGIARVSGQLDILHATGIERTQALAQSMTQLGGSTEAMNRTLTIGNDTAASAIATIESLLLALDAAAREIDDTLPGALTRLDDRIAASRGVIGAARPELLALVSAAENVHDAIEAIATVIADQRRATEQAAATVNAAMIEGHGRADELGRLIAGSTEQAHRFAEEAAPRLVEALLRVRDTATAAADRARETLATVIPEATQALEVAGAEALRRAASHSVEAHVAGIADVAEAAVAAAERASERLERQVAGLSRLLAEIETRITDVRTEQETEAEESFARRASLLIEAMNSAAIDITRTFAPDVADSAWASYLKGDRGVFTRRAVRLLDGAEQRDIHRLYDTDAGFRDQVNRYIHDFEAMLRTILTQRDGSPLGVTLLSSDMGKLYVALAQAIERLR